jgi:hypothetical protein
MNARRLRALRPMTRAKILPDDSAPPPREAPVNAAWPHRVFHFASSPVRRSRFGVRLPGLRFFGACVGAAGHTRADSFDARMEALFRPPSGERMALSPDGRRPAMPPFQVERTTPNQIARVRDEGGATGHRARPASPAASPRTRPRAGMPYPAPRLGLRRTPPTIARGHGAL